MVSIFETAVVAEGDFRGTQVRFVGQLGTIAESVAKTLKYSLDQPSPLSVIQPSAQEVCPVSLEDLSVLKQLICNDELAIVYCAIRFGWVTPEQLELHDLNSVFKRH